MTMTMTFTDILYQKQGGVARVTLNRPQAMNSVNMHTLHEMEAAFNDIEQDPEVKVVVVSGAGERAFSAGGDLKQMHERVQDQVNYVAKYNQVMNQIERCSRPTVARINGLALAGGIEIALACDILIAAEDTWMGDQHANIGSVPGAGASQRLARTVGVKKALELVLSGNWVSATEAKRIGLVNHVVPREKLDERVNWMVESLLDKSSPTMKWAKYAIQRGSQVDLMTGLDIERWAAYRAQVEGERGGWQSFGRKPVFEPGADYIRCVRPEEANP